MVTREPEMNCIAVTCKFCDKKFPMTNEEYRVFMKRNELLQLCSSCMEYGIIGCSICGKQVGYVFTDDLHECFNCIQEGRQRQDSGVVRETTQR